MNHQTKRKLRKDRYCPVCSRPTVSSKPGPQDRRVCEVGHVWRMVNGQAVVIGSLVGL